MKTIELTKEELEILIDVLSFDLGWDEMGIPENEYEALQRAIKKLDEAL